MTLRSLVLAGALAAAATAPGLARADQAQGPAEISAVQVDQSMVELNGKPFRVSDSTAIEDKEGHKIGLMQLPSLERGASADQAAVWYEAEDEATRGGAPLLYRLKLTGMRPR
ncbi:MAG TPA: hypothetical protein VMT77_05500 [Gemmatimonadales bacterium]|nr:hypothetical protein [Gemmatimonadales bacterium]